MGPHHPLVAFFTFVSVSGTSNTGGRIYECGLSKCEVLQSLHESVLLRLESDSRARRAKTCREEILKGRHCRTKGSSAIQSPVVGKPGPKILKK